MDELLKGPELLRGLFLRPVLLLPFLALALMALVLGWRAHRRPGASLIVIGQKPLWQSLGLALLLLGLGAGIAEPRWGAPEAPRLTVRVLLDASRSMGAVDAGGRSRYEAATAFLDRLWSEPAPGVAYSLDVITGDIVPLLPPGEDRTLLRETLLAVKPGAVGSPGSSFGRGIPQAIAELDKEEPAVLLLLSDGEETWESEGDALARATEALKKARLPLYAAGFGGPSPQPAPGVIGAGKEPLFTTARPEFLRQLAESSGGALATTPEALRTEFADLAAGRAPLPLHRSLQPTHPEAGAWLALLGLSLWLLAAGRPLRSWRPVLLLLLAFGAHTQARAQSLLPDGVRAWVAQRELENGDLDAARRWAPTDAKPSHLLLSAQIQLRARHPDQALAALGPLLGQGAPHPLPAWRAPALLMAARAQLALGKAPEARAFLERLLLEQPGQPDAAFDLQSLVKDPQPPPPPDPHKPPPPPATRPSMGAQKDELEGRQLRLPQPKEAPKGVKDI